MDTGTSDDGSGYIYVSMSETVTATAYIEPDDNGPAGVREPVRPHEGPPALAVEVEAQEG